MSLFSSARRAVDQARSYAARNPDKFRQVTGKAAGFADRQTRGRYRRQIDAAVRKVDGLVHGEHRRGH